jgi:UDP:flavonoid glycosyltransferase YjiC (YdhE family)
MHIAIIALGSQGDVQPYVALGRGLQEAGHVVRLVTHENFQALARSQGLECWPVPGNVQEVAESEEMRALLAKGNFLAIAAFTAKEARRISVQWAREGVRACQGMDLLLGGIGGLYIGLALAEKLGIPFIQAHVLPFTPTAAFPGVLFPRGLSRLGGMVNRASHHLVRQIMWQSVRSADLAVRREVLHIPVARPLTGPYRSRQLQGHPILYGFSPAVIAKPPDWGRNTHVTGYWFVDPPSDWTPPSALLAFLQAGPPPIYIGFGSMGSRNPKETAQLALHALTQTNQRAIMLSGWGGLRPGDLPDSVFLVDSIPHAWLFPRVAAVVHHGGAGTTAAGLRAGVPTVVIPFFGDQGFWGQQVAALGAGPVPIPRKQLTANRLASAIQQATSDPAMRRRASALGSQIQAEDGIARAVDIIGQWQRRAGITSVSTRQGVTAQYAETLAPSYCAAVGFHRLWSARRLRRYFASRRGNSGRGSPTWVPAGRPPQRVASS